MFDCPNCCKDDKSPYYGKCLYDEVYLRTCDSNSKNAEALNEATSQTDSTLSAELCPYVSACMHSLMICSTGVQILI